MERRSILIDRETGLFAGWYFWVRVLDEVTRAARYGSPFGLLLLDIDDAAAGGHRHVLESLSALTRIVRSSDVAGRSGDASGAVMLLEQEAGSAESGASRILDALAETTGANWRHRLLCYPRDGGEITTLLAEGAVA